MTDPIKKYYRYEVEAFRKEYEAERERKRASKCTKKKKISLTEKPLDLSGDEIYLRFKINNLEMKKYFGDMSKGDSIALNWTSPNYRITYNTRAVDHVKSNVLDNFSTTRNVYNFNGPFESFVICLPIVRKFLLGGNTRFVNISFKISHYTAIFNININTLRIADNLNRRIYSVLNFKSSHGDRKGFLKRYNSYSRVYIKDQQDLKSSIGYILVCKDNIQRKINNIKNPKDKVIKKHVSYAIKENATMVKDIMKHESNTSDPFGSLTVSNIRGLLETSVVRNTKNLLIDGGIYHGYHCSSDVISEKILSSAFSRIQSGGLSFENPMEKKKTRGISSILNFKEKIFSQSGFNPLKKTKDRHSSRKYGAKVNSRRSPGALPCSTRAMIAPCEWGDSSITDKNLEKISNTHSNRRKISISDGVLNNNGIKPITEKRKSIRKSAHNILKILSDISKIKSRSNHTRKIACLDPKWDVITFSKKSEKPKSKYYKHLNFKSSGRPLAFFKITSNCLKNNTNLSAEIFQRALKGQMRIFKLKFMSILLEIAKQINKGFPANSTIWNDYQNSEVNNIKINSFVERQSDKLIQLFEKNKILSDYIYYDCLALCFEKLWNICIRLRKGDAIILWSMILNRFFKSKPGLISFRNPLFLNIFLGRKGCNVEDIECKYEDLSIQSKEWVVKKINVILESLNIESINDVIRDINMDNFYSDMDGRKIFCQIVFLIRAAQSYYILHHKIVRIYSEYLAIAFKNDLKRQFNFSRSFNKNTLGYGLEYGVKRGSYKIQSVRDDISLESVGKIKFFVDLVYRKDWGGTLKSRKKSVSIDFSRGLINETLQRQESLIIHWLSKKSKMGGFYNTKFQICLRKVVSEVRSLVYNIFRSKAEDISNLLAYEKLNEITSASATHSYVRKPLYVSKDIIKMLEAKKGFVFNHQESTIKFPNMIL